MMQKAHKKILPILVSAVAIVMLTMAPALAKDSKNKKSSYSPTKAAAEAAASNHDEKPGPAWRTFNGTVKKIESNAYTVEDYEGNHVRVYVGQGTKHLKQKKVGDTVRAEITRGGFANSIQ
jgi:ribosomal protein L21E